MIKSTVTTEKALKDLIATSPNGKVLVKFSAAWCNPCKTLNTVLDGLATDVTKQFIPVADVDIDNSPELVQKFRIRGIPTTFCAELDSSGMIVGATQPKVGAIGSSELSEMMEIK